MASNDTLKNIIGVALGVCLVCSILVSITAVALKPRQENNKTMEKRKNVLIAGGLIEEKEQADIEAIFTKSIRPALIDLATGERLPKEKMTGDLAPDTYDIKKISKDPGTSTEVPAGEYDSDVKRVPKQILLYMVKEKGTVSKIIFPVIGKGLWSTMYGFLALDKDMKTVRGFTFYEHGETPGLGGEVDNKKWKAAWKGKLIFDETLDLKLEVIKGIAPAESTTQVDGLAGSTLTTRGIDNMLKLWFGPKGYYKPFLEKLKKEGMHE
jgi:Na+-transporting NADH:ubiquinone oxidoreductase subunit C